MTGYDNRASRYDWIVAEGSDASIVVTAVDDLAAAVDLSAATITATVETVAGSDVASIAAVLSGAGSNIITLSLTDLETSQIAAGRFRWTLIVTRAGVTLPWLAGSFHVVDPSDARRTAIGDSITVGVDTNVTVTVTGVAGDHSLAPNTQTIGYTLVLSDESKVVEMDSSSPLVLTVPPSSAVPFAIGTIVGVYRKGTGTVTVAAGVGVTVRNAGALFAQYSEAVLRVRATDEWVLTGDLP